MKNYKGKIISWLAVLAIAASMTGCGNINNDGAATKCPDIPTSGAAAEKSEKKAETKAASKEADTADNGGAGDEATEAFEAETGADKFFTADTDAALTYDTADDMAVEGALGEKSMSSGFTKTEDDRKTEIAFDKIGDDKVKCREPIDDELDEAIEAPIDAKAFVLTAGEWNDNRNWGFFRNLVDNGTISFPSYGVDPRNRIEVKVTNGGTALANQKVELTNGDGSVIWESVTDKNGTAYVFYESGDSPAAVRSGDTYAEVNAAKDDADNGGQGTSSESGTQNVTLDTGAENTVYDKTEVMFILDTTGSMGDEIAYLQKDFSSIAEEVAADNVSFSMNFYRDEGDEYVTKCNDFTTDVKELQKQLNAERADGGGDWEEAVADILRDTITNGSWSGDTNKIAFLIFDAPPHPGTEATVNKAVKSASAQGIHLVPVIASNSERETELFGRAVSVCTNSNYVFITDDSGVGGSHLEPIIGDYDVELLHDIIVRNIRDIS